MADIQTKSFDTLVTEQTTNVQGASTSLVDFTIGSILRAIVEAYSAVALWLQALVLKVLALTRAATSAGSDLDTWMADYGLARLPAVAATALETFSRFTPTVQSVVPVGTIVQTADGSQQYAVVLDTTNSAYSAALGGYVLGAGISTVQAPVQALTAGTGANAAAGGINVLARAIPGVDSVTNVAAVQNGENAETDTALRARFVQYIASLSKATKGAVAYAVSSVESGLVFNIVENQNYDGSAHLGFFYVIVDDGSGAPSSGLISQVYAAIDAVRPVTITFAVFGPTVITVTIAIEITVAAGYDIGDMVSAVNAAIASYLDTLPLGSALSWSRLYQVAYDASPGVIDASALLINGATNDIPATTKQVIKAGSIAVTPAA